MRRTGLGLLCIGLLQVGCGDGAPGDSSQAAKTSPPGSNAIGNQPANAVGQAGAPSDPGTIPTGGVAVPAEAPALPTDTRTAIIAATPPPAISGGTMLVADDGLTVIAADPDRDRVSIVDVAQRKVLAQIALKAGDEPGRLVQDAKGRVHIVLRGAGAVATLDLHKQSITDRRQVCGAPRGIAYDVDADALHVACVSGDLVTLPADGGKATRSMRVAEDLRDVVVQDGKLLVTQFRSAALLELDDAGQVMHRRVPQLVQQTQFSNFSESTGPRTFAPSLARRAIAISNGRTLVLHQRAMNDTIEVANPHDASSVESADDSANTNAMMPAAARSPEGKATASFPGSGGSSAYGNGDGCQSIVQTAVSIVDEDGNIVQSSSLPGTVLAVDVAVSPDGSSIAVAGAGTRDPNAPFAPFGGFGVPMMAAPPMAFPGGSALPPQFINSAGQPGTALGTVTLLSTSAQNFHSETDLMDGCTSSGQVQIPGQPIAVAYAKDGGLLIQSREPAAIFLTQGGGSIAIALGGDSVLDTGHELFHRDAGAGIACASCHGEGGDDGHVWNFSNSGPRRTQSVNVGLEGTAPFHWDGDLKDLATLMDTVFVGRMGGAPQTPERVDALSAWLFVQQPPARMRAANDKSALRGKELFDSKDVGCTSCHSGSKFTDNKTVDVGTGGALQVPSLIGIAYRAPFIHDGCAATLRDRFDPACGGGEKHGHTAQLSDDDLGDLVAYLETL